MIHVLMQSIFWFDIIRKQKFDGTTNVDELHQSQIWIEIKIKISLILLLQVSSIYLRYNLCYILDELSRFIGFDTDFDRVKLSVKC
jgi:hypothetical protein